MKTEPKTDFLPLSPMQQGMLYHQLAARAPGVDVEQIYCTMREDLSVPAFERAWRFAVERHSILRTSFHLQESAAPRQVIHANAEFEFTSEDWRALTEAARQEHFHDRLAAERRRGFDVAEAPLMRLAVFRTGEREFQFLWTFHHLLLDGRGVVLLLDEVFATCEAFARGVEPVLPAPVDCRDFVQWLAQRDLTADGVYWRQMLGDFTAPTPLVLPHPPADETGEFPVTGRQTIRLSNGDTAALKAFAKEHGVTLNTLIQGAWTLLLGRYSGGGDVVFGAVRAGRHSTVSGAENIVGMCINTVPVRVRMPLDADLVPWLAGLRENWIALRAHEHTPLTEIQSWSGVPRGLPLFESILNFQDPAWDQVLRARGGAWAGREFGLGSQSNYPLVVDARGGDALEITILYHRNRFDAASIERMLGHFETLLNGMAANPAMKLAAVPMLTARERHQLVVEWNDTRVEIPIHQNVAQLFAARAERAPEALAVADEKNQLTYGGLSERANNLAAILKQRGVGPGDCVAVMLERSVEMVVAILAVLKTGAAYLPLDPAHPRERVAFMLEDARAPVLLTRDALRAGIDPGIPGLGILCVDTDCDAVPVDHTTVAERGSGAKSIDHTEAPAGGLAYVIYTSGSTGTPKGVEIGHTGLLNLVAWHQRAYNITAADRAAQIASPSFDASVWEVWPYLTAGAAIYIPDDETRLCPKKLLAWLLEKKITTAFVPTPIAGAMLEQTWPATCELRALLTGGDTLRQPPPEGLPFALINHYGPTESTVVATATVVPPSRNGKSAPPIGRPIANTQAHILDHAGRLTPIGVPGELHIGGTGLARGYRHNPGLTAEKFIPNPIAGQFGSRLYKTGDWARWRDDGQIEYLGRIDSQVKIRGQRIEPGEIEAVLGRHPGVGECLVIPFQDNRGETRLAAYMIPNRDCPVSPTALRDFLKSKLPDAMVPSVLIPMEKFPLTINGKVDRQSLPAPAMDGGSERSFAAPATPVQQSLVTIWREVLGVERIGLYDNFFDLGGHSLLATRAISRIRTVFSVEMPLTDIFDAPTLAELADRIETIKQPTVPVVLPASAQWVEAPLSAGQERIWFMEQLEPGLPVNNIPIAIQLDGSLNQSALERALREIIQRHQALRTEFRGEGGRPAAKIIPAPEFFLARADLSGLPPGGREAEAARLRSDEARKPFDLARGPLLRGKLVCIDENTHWLLLTIHHIVCDGWSLGILYRELAALYEAFSQERPSPLSEVPAGYIECVRVQRDWLAGRDFEGQIAYWRNQLESAQTTLDLPLARTRPAIQSYRGAIENFTLPAGLLPRLTVLARRENATLFMVLLSAFQTLLNRYTRREDLLVASPVAGRTRVETESVVGLFLNTLVLRGDLSGDPAFRELLWRNRRTALTAYANQDLPFEKLVEALQPERDSTRSPLCQVMFILQNQPLQPLELAGLKLTPAAVHSGTAKYDLTLSVEETAGGLAGFIEYNSDLFDAGAIKRMLGHFEILLGGIVANPNCHISKLPLLAEEERRRMLVDWNHTATEFDVRCVHQSFEAQAARTPGATAIVFDDQELTYRELNDNASQLALRLRSLGVGPDVPVAICVRRSPEMMTCLLGILKAGGCYVPLDPAYPPARLAFMLKDSKAGVVLTQKSLRDNPAFHAHGLNTICVDSMDFPPAILPPAVEAKSVTPANLAYLMYTSGSTGQPKGVMVTHRNVANFFAGMDRVLGTEPGVWLAVTSISFDISVLELFWTLARGYKVIIQPEEETIRVTAPRPESTSRGMDFSLFYFSSNDSAAGNKYRLLIEGAKFADRNGFSAVWTPERHFHPFGGLYPNPSVTGAAVAMVTERLQIRAGSVVLPLHNPIRVAEEWSVVDNLSNGRTAISFASGWHDRDFALAPDSYPRRKEVLLEQIETVRRLWRGGSIMLPGGTGKSAEIKIHPQPVQRDLPMWLTASGNPETFRKAGELGMNLLTHLLGQSLEELADKIRVYRNAWREHHESPPGKVTLMLHTFVGGGMDNVLNAARGPFCKYLKSSLDLLRNLTASPGGLSNLENLSETDLDALAEHAFDRYAGRFGLFGTPKTCLQLIQQLKSADVDEVACLIDFGVDEDLVLANLPRLNELREAANNPLAPAGMRRTIAEQIARHQVTHLQCTPSLAKSLILAPESLPAIRALKELLLGGEAMPASLAEQLAGIGPRLLNMYGPTETTVWSASHHVENAPGTVPIGRPIANTRVYVLDSQLEPVPAGVPGELLIGGEGVARGYWNQDQLTAEKFISDPFVSNTNSRLYRTGDLARWLPDGSLEFLGRLDQQVKIRGQRIELGEVESALGLHPDIRDVVVAVREDSPGDARLVAYVVPETGARPSVANLRAFAGGRLTGAMIPAAFVFLDALPLTPNGKINRKALPAPGAARPVLETDYAAPHGNLESVLVSIWRDLLHVENIGRHDNFFDLGGNSMLIVQLQARLREALGVSPPIVRLFQYPTVGTLAGFLGQSAEPAATGTVSRRGLRKRMAFDQAPKSEDGVMV